MKDAITVLICVGLMQAVMAGPLVAGEIVGTHPDTWTATDFLGRTVPSHEEVGARRPGKTVGIFYFLWLGQHHTEGPYDITRILAGHPDALGRPTSPPWGPEYRFHHWGEPLFGYYLSDDAWVLRKHAQMLSDALVDVIIFDVTNQETYAKAYHRLCEVFTQVRRDGGRTPQIAFLCPFGDPGKVVARLYEDLYKPGRYRDLWFRWKGKPLILADPEKVAPDLRSFFTFRKPHSNYFAGPRGPGQWGWLAIHPQPVLYDADGKPEEMAVGVAQNGSGKRLCAFSEDNTYGRSWHDGKKDEQPDAVLHGLNFTEQWEHALKIDPEFIFITGWNEWIALRLPEFAGVRKPVMFVDEFTQEYSRDVEPMKGGHADNYYYQMISYIRRFKGVRPPPSAARPTAIRIDGEFADWARVKPEYRDDRGDTMHRDHPGYDNAGRYVNKTGRNDFVLLKAAADDQRVSFYARTAAPITARTVPRWMLLFINADNNPSTGWEGYDFRVNHAVRSETKSVLERAGKSGTWEPVGGVEYHVAGTELELALPRQTLGLHTGSPMRLTFKWADNIQKDNDVMEFTVNGDAAPNARFQYVFVAE